MAKLFKPMVDDVEALSLVRELVQIEFCISANQPADGLEIIINAEKVINQLLLLQNVSKYHFVHKVSECVGWRKL